ncbi:MAG: hypothetical protein HFJ42_09640 [Clostridia bacterium]|nr:hypothetical protein [Clostridia bacterium]
MAIIAFWSDEKRETGQTLSMVALTTYMAIEHNYKILNVSTNFKDETLENCYWSTEKQNTLIKGIAQGRDNVIGLESGIEGLVKIIKSNKTTPNIVSNYSKAIFSDRLDVLTSPKTKIYSEYLEIAKMYPEILDIANRNYDLIFVDISKNMGEEEANRILEIADVIVINMTQKLQIIDKIGRLREENNFFKKDNILFNVGRYDKFSKYNIKNISRYLRLKRDILVVPYNTLFFESCSEAKVTELFLRLRNTDTGDRNQNFMQEISRMAKELIYKLQELQIKI